MLAASMVATGDFIGVGGASFAAACDGGFDGSIVGSLGVRLRGGDLPISGALGVALSAAKLLASLVSVYSEIPATVAGECCV